MMNSCIPFIKYIYILILFIFSWVCLFHPSMELIGFGSLVVIQSAYMTFLGLEIMRDPNRNEKAIVIPQAPVKNPRLYTIPLWWILIPSTIFYWISSILMIITTQTLWKNTQSLNLSPEFRGKIQYYKITFIIGTILMLFLTITYITTNTGSAFSGTYRLILLFAMVGALGLSVTDLMYSNEFSKLIGSKTDG